MQIGVVMDCKNIVDPATEIAGFVIKWNIGEGYLSNQISKIKLNLHSNHHLNWSIDSKITNEKFDQLIHPT